MSIGYIREHYKVPAKIGGRIKFTDGDDNEFTCTIFSTSGCHLKVRAQGIHDKGGYWIVHPTWNIEYLQKT